MATLLLTRGIPGSGKTTWALNWVKEDPENRVRVNRDDLRHMLFGPDYAKPDHHKENMVTEVQHDIVVRNLVAGRDVVVDDMHLRAAFVKAWYELWPDVEFQDFPVSVETAVFRDAQRQSAGGRGVGEDVIRDIAKRFLVKGQLPAIPERADAVAKYAPYVPKSGLPNAILVDIDGTLAHMHDRSPYDGTRYHEDTLDDVSARLVALMSEDHTVIIMSGRDAEYRRVTETWLAGHGVDYQEFYMRAQGDKRKDDVVKNELFETHIAGRYNISFVLDDRDRVVNMWRTKGIKCLQVAEGNF